VTVRLYFGGAEIPGWRTMLAEQEVENVALSYMGLRRRTKFTKPWLLAEQFPAEQRIFLDSGGYTVNNDDQQTYSVGELKDIAAAYMAFVDANLDRADMVSEFDVRALGVDWVRGMREDFWDDVPDDKFLPIWHPEYGIGDLDRLAQRYPRLAVMQTALDGRNLVPVLNGMVQKYGTKLHGIAMTKPEVLSQVRFSTVASTSWISPTQYGDTIVWTGKELKRYPRRYKDAARKRHRTYFIQHGFDHEAIEKDDNKEVLRLSIWSWKQQMLHLERTPGAEVVAIPPPSDTEGVAEVGTTDVGTPGAEMRKSGTTPVRERSERLTLPVLGITTQRVEQPDNGEALDIPLLTTRSQSMRVCDSCFLANKCPAFSPGSNCAYDIPMEIRTKDQMKALQHALIEIQSQRVLFMRMAEDLEGGYADPNLSSELDRLQKMIKISTELESDQFSIRFEARGAGDGGAGVLSRLFGRDAGEQSRALPGGPVPAEDAVQYLDAEVIDVYR
jgi:hypothetical protein